MAEARVQQLGGAVLEGRHVRLEPLRLEHTDALVAASREPGIFRWFRVDLSTPEAMTARVTEQVAAFAAGTKAAYAVVLKATGEVVGSTGYNEIDRVNRAVEIGATWFNPRHWGGVVNPESKLLVMRHAFEDWGALRVWLKTDSKNERSAAAILKLGARPEGVLRWHVVRPDGTMRDSAVFSIIPPEWPAVKAGLERRLEAAG